MTDLDKIIRPSLKQLQPYNSGLSMAAVQKLCGLAEVNRLASNENPFGPAPDVLEYIRKQQDHLHIYPSSEASDLRTGLAAYLDTDPDLLVFGNGSEELLSIIFRSVIEPGDRVITLYPSFPLHEDYAVLMGAGIERVGLRDDLTIDVDKLVAAASKPTKLLIFSHPVNPVGCWMSRDDLMKVLDTRHPDTLLVLDEAYFEFALNGDYCSGLDLLASGKGHWIVLRTFSKAWGLAGLRIGYGVCSSPDLAAALDLTKTPFNTNTLAQTAALLALGNEAHTKKSVTAIAKERDKMRTTLMERDLRVAPTQANYVFFETDLPSVEVADALMRLGTLVKPWKQEGFDRFIRVTVGRQEENRLFLDHLDSIRVQNTHNGRRLKNTENASK
ncbi:MAG: histidinol-phosphate transaminase [Roseibium album]|uniref:histidinol-phosphate transaminase n=1 Tax=Roseibium album TaxID=311410 RepID=UPI0032ECCC43